MRILFSLWMILLVMCLMSHDLITYSACCRIDRLNLDEVYVINLDSRFRRLRAISADLNRQGIPFKRFSAVHGLELQVFDLMNRCSRVDIKNFDWSSSFNSRVQHLVYHPMVPEAAFIADSTFGLPKNPTYGYFTPGELGCFYSHRAVWCDIVKHKYKSALILEDDVVLYDGFSEVIKTGISEVPKDADLILVDFWEYTWDDHIHVKLHSPLDVSPLPGNKIIGLLRCPEKCTLGAYAYILTTKGAKKLLALTSRMKRCVDVIMMEARATGKLKVYFFRPKLLGMYPYRSDISSLGREKYQKRLFTAMDENMDI